jgi:hypothetical protein
MVITSSHVVNQSLLTQFLKFSLEFYALIYKHFSWNIKSTQIRSKNA